MQGTPRIDLHTRIEHDFTNHPPADETVIARFEHCRDAALTAGHFYIEQCPPSRELSLALTKLEESLMYARAAIARNQDNLGPNPGAQSERDPVSQL